MRLFPALLVASLISTATALPAPAGDAVPREYARARDALEILIRVPSGRAVLQRAQEFWKLDEPMDVLSVLRWGSASRTDAVLTRHLDPKTGKEYREREVTVYLRKDQPLEDIVLDVAHEMVHATTTPTWDPYDPKLTTAKYIHATIEGTGGEVDAVIQECKVGLELASRFGASAKRCRKYRAETEKTPLTIDREKVRKDFYRVGHWLAEIRAALGEEAADLPLLSGEKPDLYSSTGHSPYPYSLMKEFELITRIACENTRKRAEAMTGRDLASTAREFLSSRCASAASDSEAPAQAVHTQAGLELH